MSNFQSLVENESNLEYLKVSKQSKKAIFMLHGYGASMNDLAGLESVMDQKNEYDWFFPNGPLRISLGGHMEGRAWFPIDMQELERAMRTGEFRKFEDKNPKEFQEALVLANKFVQNLSKEYDEVIIGGFSQGAMVTSHLSGMDIKSLKGLILFSGTLLAKDSLIEKLDGKDAVPFFQSHGKMDPVLNFDESMKLFELLKLCRFQGEFVPFDGAHEIPPIVINKVVQFLDRI